MFLSVLVLIFTYGVVGFMAKMEETSHNKEIAENKVAELERQKKELSAKIAELNTAEGKEGNIREKYGLAKEGEDLIVVIEDKNLTEVKDNPPQGFFYFLKNLFK